jgi:hypothetical protein
MNKFEIMIDYLTLLIDFVALLGPGNCRLPTEDSDSSSLSVENSSSLSTPAEIK